jgi:hypothetical protein
MAIAGDINGIKPGRIGGHYPIGKKIVLIKAIHTFLRKNVKRKSRRKSEKGLFSS